MITDYLKDKKNPPRCVFNQCPLTAISGAKPVCDSDSKCSLYREDFPGHGFCQLLKDAPKSTEIGVCTHNPNIDNFATVVDQCKQINSASVCRDTKNICLWNDRPILPSEDTDVCTHNSKYNMVRAAVNACEAIKDADDCDAYEGGMCNYNYAPVEPSTNMEVCTHRFEFSTQR
jgi:hypothetical protein